MTRPAVAPAHPLRLLLALLAGVALVLGLSAPVSAHGEEGTWELVSAERGDGQAVDLVVRLTFTNDGDPVTDATVTAVVGDAATDAPASTTEAATTTSTTAPPGQAVLVDDEDSGLSTGALVAMGAGVAGVAAAGVFAAYKQGQKKDEDERQGPPPGSGPGNAPPGSVR
ncbi:hypothetical protein BH24ACT4_BH24ACT4_22920 [soil metagenome]